MAFLPLADDEAKRLLASVPEAKRGECWWLVMRDGTAIAGDRGGGALLLANLRVTRPLGRALLLPRLSALVDGFDRFIAAHRKGLGRFVPDGPAPRQYP